ncbi:MAG: hypothetical protein ABEK17_00110, partial [Candidatus Aenigmatarchaeota archaeon]
MGIVWSMVERNKSSVKGFSKTFVLVMLFLIVLSITNISIASDGFSMDIKDNYNVDDSISIKINGSANTPFSLVVLDESDIEIYSKTASTNSKGLYSLYLPSQDRGKYTVILKTGPVTLSKTFHVGDTIDTEKSGGSSSQPTEFNETSEEKTEEASAKSFSNSPVSNPEKSHRKIEFNGRTTNISNISNPENISNLVIEKTDYGSINYKDSLNLTGRGNLSSIVKIRKNLIEVDTTKEPRLNKSATLEFRNLSYKRVPLIYRNDKFCSDCSINYYNSGDLSFNVSHFTNYTTSSNSNLTIWDETDPKGGNKIKSAGDQVDFYANYTNKTSGVSINSSDVYCEIDFNTAGFTPTNMTYNNSRRIYEYNRSFSSSGTYNWNVSCDGTSQGYEPLNISDDVD